MKTTAEELLKEFSDYVKSHPKERFWQALKNWSGHEYILARGPDTLERGTVVEDIPVDTFFWEGKDR